MKKFISGTKAGVGGAGRTTMTNPGMKNGRIVGSSRSRAGSSYSH